MLKTGDMTYHIEPLRKDSRVVRRQTTGARERFSLYWGFCRNDKAGHGKQFRIG